MTLLDDFLQNSRIRKATPFIPANSVVLDIGCHHGELFIKLGKKLGYGVGIDPILEKEIITENYELIKDVFPSEKATKRSYDRITMLAVLEHLPPEQQIIMTEACFKSLHPGGAIIITVPDQKVDLIIEVLHKLRLMKGIQFHEHYGFDISNVRPLFENAGFTMIKHKKFQLGLNNLFIFKKP